jgi:hypothetical protein
MRLRWLSFLRLGFFLFALEHTYDFAPKALLLLLLWRWGGRLRLHSGIRPSRGMARSSRMRRSVDDGWSSLIVAEA